MRKKDTQKEENSWHRAGLSDPNSAHVGRPLGTARYYDPVGIEVDEDRLVWRDDRKHERIPEPQMLDEFVQLYKAPLQRIRDYANHWGILRLCKHNLPISHNPPHHPLPTIGTKPSRDWIFCEPLKSDNGVYKYWEPIEVWQQLSLFFRALLNLSAAIHLDQPGKSKHWQVVDTWLKNATWIDDANRYHSSYLTHQPTQRFWEPDWSIHQSVSNRFLVNQSQDKLKEIEHSVKMDFARLLFGCCISILQRMGDVKLEWVWTWKAGIIFEIGIDNLFGALIAQLMLSISKSNGSISCSACGEFYQPSRRPRLSQRNYCPKKECRQNAAWRNASERQYKKKKENNSNTPQV